MTEYINKEDSVFTLYKDIEDIEPADVAPVMTVQWEWFEEWDPGTSDHPRECEDCGWRCSRCKTSLEAVVGGYWDNSDEVPKIKFCPNCGAKMDLEDMSDNFDVDIDCTDSVKTDKIDAKCKYEGTGIWSGRCTGTKEVDPCIGYEKCELYSPIHMTNADRIRAMTDDELNELFNEIYNAGVDDASSYEWGHRTNSFEWTMDWLQQPPKGE